MQSGVPLTPPRTCSLFPLGPTKWEIYHRPLSHNHQQSRNVNGGTSFWKTPAYHGQPKPYKRQQYAGRCGTGPDSWIFLFAHNTRADGHLACCAHCWPPRYSAVRGPLHSWGRLLSRRRSQILWKGRLPSQLHTAKTFSHRDINLFASDCCKTDKSTL